MPPFLYSWTEGRNEIAESLDQLRDALSAMTPNHPAMPAMLEAARDIDGWLASWPAEPQQMPFEPGPRSWNENVAPKLIETGTKIKPLFDR